jgi:hypothetical protein
MNKPKKNISAFDAKSEAQRIAFAPMIFQTVHCLLKFKVFEVFKTEKNGCSFDVLKTRTGISAYGLQVLLEMAETGNVIYKQNDQYFLTKTGYFLANDPMTKVNFGFVQDVCYQGLFHLDKSIETGRPEGLKVFGNWPTIYDGLSQLPEKAKESWFLFDHFYSDDSFDEALKIVFQNNPKHILDIGGNTGKWTKRCCNYNAEVKMSIVDLPGQIAVAKQNVLDWKLADRVEFVPCNILTTTTQLPQADVVWMSQFLDCFSPAEIKKIVKHVVESIDQTSDVYIMETFWDNQSHQAASLSLAATSLYFTAMANGNSKMYGESEFVEILESAGLKIVNRYNKVGISHSILHCQKN